MSWKVKICLDGSKWIAEWCCWKHTSQCVVFICWICCETQSNWAPINSWKKVLSDNRNSISIDDMFLQQLACTLSNAKMNNSSNDYLCAINRRFSFATDKAKILNIWRKNLKSLTVFMMKKCGDSCISLTITVSLL